MALEYQNLNQRVYAVIKENIINSKFPSGSRLQEDFLVNELGISKTPIKLALARLEQENLVETIPHRGTYVVQLNEESMRKLYTLREVLEGLAARLAAKHISDQDIQKIKKNLTRFNPSSGNLALKSYLEIDAMFHQIIMNASENPYLQESLEHQYDLITMYKLKIASKRLNTNESYLEHLKIFEALEAGESEIAEQAMRHHIRRGTEVFLVKQE